MSKTFAEIARHPARFGALTALAIAITMIALFLAQVDTQAGHQANLLELDLGTNCPDPNGPATPFPICGNGNTTNDGAAQAGAFDWEDICATFGDAGKTPGAGFDTDDITERTSLPTDVDVSSCIRDYPLADHTYFNSEKDIRDVAGTLTNDVWDCVEQNNILPKNEILNGYAIKATGPVGGVDHEFLYYGVERQGKEGVAFFGFWFMQGAANCTHSGSNDTAWGEAPFNSTPHVAATATTPGDILVILNYEGGGRITNIFVAEWDPGLFGPNPAPCTWAGAIGRVADHLCLISASGDCSVFVSSATPTPPVLTADAACAVVNNQTINPGSPTDWNSSPDKIPCSGAEPCALPLEVNQFFEGNIDLTQLLCTPPGGATPVPGCEVPCFSTFVAETRSSAEFTATLKDYLRGEFVTCTGAIKILKVDESGPPPNLLPGACFSITGATLETPLSVCDEPNDPDRCPLTPTQSCNATDEDDSVGEVCIDGLASGDYTVTETVVPDGYIGDPDTPTATVPTPLTTNITCLVGPGPTGTAVVTFVNRQGSLIIRKEAKNASTEDPNDLLGGATFRITPDPTGAAGTCGAGTEEDPTVDDCLEVTDDSAPDVFDTTPGLICIDDVVAGSYTVKEHAAPANYLKPDPDFQTGIEAEADDCAGRGTTAGADVTFDNMPLSEIEIIFRSLAGVGITQLETPIVCEKSALDVPDNDADSDGSDPNHPYDDATLDREEVFTDLEPGTYVCTIVIDP